MDIWQRHKPKFKAALKTCLYVPKITFASLLKTFSLCGIYLLLPASFVTIFFSAMFLIHPIAFFTAALLSIALGTSLLIYTVLTFIHSEEASGSLADFNNPSTTQFWQLIQLSTMLISFGLLAVFLPFASFYAITNYISIAVIGLYLCYFEFTATKDCFVELLSDEQLYTADQKETFDQAVEKYAIATRDKQYKKDKKTYINTYESTVEFLPLNLRTIINNQNTTRGYQGPISLLIQYDPVKVVQSDFKGTYEKKKILKHFKTKNTEPITRQVLTNLTLEPQPKLAQAIDNHRHRLFDWVTKHSQSEMENASEAEFIEAVY